MEGLPRAKRGSRDYLNALTYSVQSPPIVVRDTVIVPASISSLHRQQGTDPGLDPRLGRAHRQAAMDVPDRAAARRVRQRHVEDDSWSYTGKVSGWSIYERRRRARLRLSAAQHHGASTTTAAIGPGDDLFAEIARLPRRRDRQARLALPVRAPRPLGLRPAAAPNLLDITVNGKRDQGGRAGHQAGIPLRVRSRHRQADLAD